MKTVYPLETGKCTNLFVTDTSPIAGIPFGTKIPSGTILENRNEKIAFDVSGLYLVDFTVGNTWCEGSVIVSK